MPSSLFTQDNKKQRTNQRMGKYDPETAQAWALIMKRIRELRAEGNTLEAIGKLMHVGRAAVSRWISEDVGGEKTTYGDMLRYAKALGIPRDELIGMLLQVWNAPVTNFTIGLDALRAKQEESA